MKDIFDLEGQPEPLETALFMTGFYEAHDGTDLAASAAQLYEIRVNHGISRTQAIKNVAELYGIDEKHFTSWIEEGRSLGQQSN